MVISILAVFFMFLGLLLYMSTNAKWSEIGRLMFFAGTLALALIAGQMTIKIP